MLSEELAKEIIADYKNVEAKTKHLLKKVRRVVVRSKGKRFQKLVEYKSPEKNDWLLCFNFSNKDVYCSPVVYYLNDFGLNAIELSHNQRKDIFSRTIMKYDLHHYTSHFLQRYNERFLKETGMPKLDILKHFIVHNPMTQVMTVPDNEKYKNGIYAKFNDGVGFGQIEVLSSNYFFHFKTFLSTDMIFEEQDDYLKQTVAESLLQYEVQWKEVLGDSDLNTFGVLGNGND